MNALDSIDLVLDLGSCLLASAQPQGREIPLRHPTGRVGFTRWDNALSDNLSSPIDSPSSAEQAVIRRGQGAQIRHRPILPNERVGFACQEPAPTDDLASVVDVHGLDVVAT